MNNWVVKKLIVTGGCGFIGSNFIKLALKGYKLKFGLTYLRFTQNESKFFSQKSFFCKM